jgi:NodT family efflux transporter outer membrane factor (OMF) lipoprotein
MKRALVAVSLVLAGCTVGPDFEVPASELPASFVEAPPDGTVSDIAVWWRSLNDPVLASLIERAIAANLDVQTAAARVREARAARQVVAADDQPQVDAFGDYRHSRASQNTDQFREEFDPDPESDLFDAGFDASWELDLFGRVRRGVEAAEADINAAEESLRNTLVAVTAEVGRNYAELRGFQARQLLAQKNADIQRDSVNLTDARFRGGLSSEVDVAGARAQLATTEAAIPTFRRGVIGAMNRIGVLLGVSPETLRSELEPVAPIPTGPSAIDPGTPEELLARRPDIRSNERLLAAASARVGVATADLYPRVFVLGSVGVAASDFSNLFEGASAMYSIGPSVTWAVFDGGRIRGRIAVQDAQLDQAQLAYRQSILAALEDVENSLAAHRLEQERVRTLQAGREASERRVTLTVHRYERGIGDFLGVLDAQRQLTLIEDELARAQQDVTAGLIAVYKSLGGGGGNGDA